MRNTTYIHAQHEEKLVVSTQFIEPTQDHSINLFGAGSQLTVFMKPEQIVQLHATLGEYIKENHALFVEKSISKLEEVKND